ncbi:MAG: hypothetical protein V3V14_12220 [Saprospiraceae bacterium]
MSIMNVYGIFLITCISIGACKSSHIIEQNDREFADLDIVVNVAQLEIDNLENIYILTPQSTILQYQDNLTLKYEYNNSIVGNINSIDVSNPQKILCFVKDFNQIIVLDNTLSEISKINLSLNNTYFEISAIARSNDNLIWIFDAFNQQLIKIDEMGNSLYKSNRLSDYNLSEISPQSIIERENTVVLYDSTIGFLIFDNFGNYKNSIPEKNISNFQFSGEFLLFVQESVLYKYHIKRFEKEQISKLPQLFKSLKKSKHKTYFINSNGIKIE